MKTKNSNLMLKALFVGGLLSLTTACKVEDEDLLGANNPTTAEVFIDGFAADLQYAAFANTNVRAFDVDKTVKYSGTASMKFEVPDADATEGAFAGGTFFTKAPRNLSGYTVLTFWAKASQPANFEVGFGNDNGENKYQTSISSLKVNSNWKKYYIPIPAADKLTGESGMFYYSAGAIDSRGYTIWVDEVKFEDLGTISHTNPIIYAGVDKTQSDAYMGITIPISGTAANFSLPDGSTQQQVVAPAYFDFTSSSLETATVSETGMTTVVGAGTSTVTATLDGVEATGSLTVNSTGNFVHAPTPTIDAADVISIFSDHYTNVAGTVFNPYWDNQNTKSADFKVTEDGVEDNVLNYYDFFNNSDTQKWCYVQNIFSPVIDASTKTHVHFDIFVPTGTSTSATMTISVHDKNTDTEISQTIPSSQLIPGQWNSIELSIKGKPRTSIDMITYKDGVNITNFWVDNIYFYKENVPAAPTVAAPTPTHAASEVISIFSDKYTNIANTNFNPNWGQATAVSEEAVAGDNTLKYTGLNYQGTHLGGGDGIPQDFSGKKYLHIDYWSTNSTSLSIYLISPGKETPVSLTVPTPINGAWSSIDIPLSSFSSVVDLTKVNQLKVVGDGDIWFDNIYLHGTASTTSGSPYCSKTVYHFMNTAEAASAIKLTVTNIDAQSVKVTIESATSDPVDLLIINSFAGAITGSPAISDADTSVAGQISKTLTWSGTPPTSFGMNILWSTVSNAGNWMLQPSSDITIKFADKCN